VIDINELLDAVLPTTGEKDISEIHDKVWAYAEEHYPDEFSEWVRAEASRGLKQHIRGVLASRRQRAFSVFNREKRATQIEAVAAGAKVEDVLPPLFDTQISLPRSGRNPVYKRFGSIVADDAAAVMNMYAEYERSTGFERAFWAQVEKKLRRTKKTLEESFTEEQIMSFRKHVPLPTD